MLFRSKVCIVSTDVDISYIEILRKFYKIYQIPDVIINGESFMKYYSLTMTQYKKILLINPNFIILQNPDFLFTLNSPAGYIYNKSLNTDLSYILFFKWLLSYSLYINVRLFFQFTK